MKFIRLPDESETLLETQFLAPKNRSQTGTSQRGSGKNSTDVNHLRVLLTVTAEGTKESRTSSFQRVKRKGRRRRKIPSFWQWSTRRRVPPPDLNLEQRLVGAPPSPRVFHKERRER